MMLLQLARACVVRCPEAERTAANKVKAMSQAAYAACLNQFPAQKAIFDKAMSQLGFSVSASFDPAQPEGIGNLAAQAVIDFRRGDGSNQDGSLTASGTPTRITRATPMNPSTVFTGTTPMSSFPHRITGSH
jgi:hypothetical protein